MKAKPSISSSRAAWLFANKAPQLQPDNVDVSSNNNNNNDNNNENSIQVKIPPHDEKEQGHSEMNEEKADVDDDVDGNDEDGENDTNNEKTKLKKSMWKLVNPLEWSPEMVQDFLTYIKIPEVIRMRIDELGLDGSELSLLQNDDFANHILIDNSELCRILRKKIDQQRKQMSKKSVCSETATSNRKGDNIYIIYDPRDAKLGHCLANHLRNLQFTVNHHGSLGKSRNEFALAQLPRLVQCSHFVVLLTPTAMLSPFVWEEVCLLRSLIQPPASSIVAVSWNVNANFLTSDSFQMQEQAGAAHRCDILPPT